jgi:hypothetical protein
MSSEATVQPETDLALVPQFHAVAVNATEMVACKTGIKNWLELKVRSIEQEIDSIQATLDAAIRNKWKSSTFKNQLQKVKQKHLYYGKLLSACNAGYTIVPNLDCDVFAIRVNRSSPSAKPSINEATGYMPCAPRIDDETEQRLPIGDGRYESPFQTIDTRRWEEKNEKNEIVHKVKSCAVDFAEIEFPLAIANPLVMDATAQAMALKIFDRIGVVNNHNQRRGDPIVLGQITRKEGYSTKTASFLIAWYLDPRTL